MENAQGKIKLYAGMKLLLNMYTRETGFAFATVIIKRQNPLLTKQGGNSTDTRNRYNNLGVQQTQRKYKVYQEQI